MPVESVKREADEWLVLEKIRELLRSGSLKPGDRLPSERQLSETFGSSRGYVRKALQRLEYYGIVKTLPQRGSVVEHIGGKASSGIIQAIIEVNEVDDFASLMDTRSVLERHSARLAAERASEEGIAAVRSAHAAFLQAASAGAETLEEDHLFHLAIARACGNGVALSLISIMTPKIIAMNRDFYEDDPGRAMRTCAEHQAVVDAIVSRDPAAADSAMEQHMLQAKARRLVRNEEAAQ